MTRDDGSFGGGEPCPACCNPLTRCAACRELFCNDCDFASPCPPPNDWCPNCLTPEFLAGCLEVLDEYMEKDL